MAAEKDLATKITEITLKKSYNSLPLKPSVKTGNPFDYVASQNMQASHAKLTPSTKAVEPQKSAHK